MIGKISSYIEEYVKENSSTAILTIFFVYAGLILYLSSYSDFFIEFKEDTYNLSEYVVYALFALSFLGIFFLFINFLILIFFYVLDGLNVYKKSFLLAITILLESIFYIFIYSDLQIYKLMGIHLYNEVVLKAINRDDLDNDISLTAKQFFEYLITPIVYILIVVILYYVLMYISEKINIKNILKKFYLFSIFVIFLSFFGVIYFWINLYGEHSIIPLWSYLDKSSIDTKFETNYGVGFNYDKIKIKNKKNILIIIAESFRKDVYNPDNTPNIHRFIDTHKGFIKSMHHFPGAHFTVGSMISLWYSIPSYYFKALFNSQNYKKSIPLQIFNRLGYDTSFLTASYLTSSYRKIREATTVFRKYKRFKSDDAMIKYFKNSYKHRDKDKAFLTMIFLDTTHYSYRLNKNIIKYRPYLLSKNISYRSDRMNKAYKDKLFRRYKNSVLYADYFFDKIVSTLEDYDRKNTIIIFIGDHGEQFWENGYFGHVKPTYTKELVDTPLFFYIPDLKKDINVKISSHLDILVTLLAYITNIENEDILKYFDGISLLDSELRKKRYLLISSFNFMGLNDVICLVNNFGKILIEAKSDDMKDMNLFKIKKYLNFNDTVISDKNKKIKLQNDFNKFKKEYFKYLKPIKN